MKCLALLGCLGMAASASAQVITMTQSDDTFTIIGLNSFACSRTNETNMTQQTAQNSYMRSFVPADYGATGQVMVTRVLFGVEAAIHPNGTQKVYIRVHRDTNGGAPTTFSELFLLGTASTDVSDTTFGVHSELTDLEIGPIDATDSLVVEVFTPSYVSSYPDNTAVFFIGSNFFGESAPTYVAAPSCEDMQQPKPATEINAGSAMHMVMVVDVEEISGDECYADCDNSDTLDFFDVLCFLNEFNTSSDYADCDESDSLDFFDVLCFLNEFNEPGPGC